MRKDTRGIVLISVLLIISVMLVLSTALARILVSNLGGISALIDRSRAFYIAEGGIEWAKCEIAANPSYYTDLPFAGDEKTWLLTEARGFKASLGSGKFKIAREKDNNIIYSAGYLGKDEKNCKALSIIKIKYSFPPFKQISWEQL